MDTLISSPGTDADSPAGTLSERVAQSIRQMVVRGELAPGQRLSEASLAATLQISRNSLREAFRILTQEGLLEHAPNRGVFVSRPSLAAVIDIYRVRRLIECVALEQAYASHPAGARMRQAVESAQRSQALDDWPAVGTANMAFHQAIVALADSARLDRMFALIQAELRLAFGMLNDPKFLHAPYAQMNLNILELFEAGKMREAAEALDSYLHHAERIVLTAYTRQTPASAR